jgi:hypothetical protein
MSDKPHLVLDWVFDIPNNKLICKINDELMYEAHEGGNEGYTKTYKGEVTKITSLGWHEEKYWISDNFGETLGYYQPDNGREQKHPEETWIEKCPNGLGPDGRYLDHMQRLQLILEGHDCATIGFGKIDKNLYSTPDNGKTIFKRVPTRDVRYKEVLGETMRPDEFWYDHPQACAMQPRAKGYQLSSYDEMLEDGIFDSVVEKCRKEEWESPKHPELQKYFIYPKA